MLSLGKKKPDAVANFPGQQLPEGEHASCFSRHSFEIEHCGQVTHFIVILLIFWNILVLFCRLVLAS